MPAPLDSAAAHELLAQIHGWSAELGFARLGVANIDLARDEAHFHDWLCAGFNGEMEYMSRHGLKRTRPADLVPGTVSCISVRMDYWPQPAADAELTLGDGARGYVSRYALGRDYHKLMRSRLQKLCDRIGATIGPFGYRAFADSAPVMEKALARNAGLGWIGKHTLLIDSQAGSYFFLGEIYLNVELPEDAAATSHCGTCSACLPACPTGAIVAPYRLDARRCISYLTIELRARFPRSSGARSATAFSAAMIASSSAPGTRSRDPAAKRIFPSGTASTTRSSSTCSPGAKRSFSIERAAARSPASATFAGCAT